eukprot:TRINITY_DN1925_c0_g1_i5.p1 TRINITY_DN1925_c0_g1~~TRINITY_DN1925_c0_g1_i5.p1  ORF type:complete len:569 (+),score=133.71 TRINITY_DN1925_c0_g1_i5:1159-2865(+)
MENSEQTISLLQDALVSQLEDNEKLRNAIVQADSNTHNLAHHVSVLESNISVLGETVRIVGEEKMSLIKEAEKREAFVDSLEHSISKLHRLEQIIENNNITNGNGNASSGSENSHSDPNQILLSIENTLAQLVHCICDREEAILQLIGVNSGEGINVDDIAQTFGLKSKETWNKIKAEVDTCTPINNHNNTIQMEKIVELTKKTKQSSQKRVQLLQDELNSTKKSQQSPIQDQELANILLNHVSRTSSPTRVKDTNDSILQLISRVKEQSIRYSNNSTNTPQQFSPKSSPRDYTRGYGLSINSNNNDHYDAFSTSPQSPTNTPTRPSSSLYTRSNSPTLNYRPLSPSRNPPADFSLKTHQPPQTPKSFSSYAPSFNTNSFPTTTPHSLSSPFSNIPNGTSSRDMNLHAPSLRAPVDHFNNANANYPRPPSPSRSHPSSFPHSTTTPNFPTRRPVSPPHPTYPQKPSSFSYPTPSKETLPSLPSQQNSIPRPNRLANPGVLPSQPSIPSMSTTSHQNFYHTPSHNTMSNTPSSVGSPISAEKIKERQAEVDRILKTVPKYTGKGSGFNV